jgi:hypothetical protein
MCRCRCYPISRAQRRRRKPWSRAELYWPSPIPPARRSSQRHEDLHVVKLSVRRMSPSWGRSRRCRRRLSPCTSALHSLFVDQSLHCRKNWIRGSYTICWCRPSFSPRTVPRYPRRAWPPSREQTNTRRKLDQFACYLPAVPRDQYILSLFRTTMSSRRWSYAWLVSTPTISLLLIQSRALLTCAVESKYCRMALRIKQPRVLPCMFNHRLCCLCQVRLAKPSKSLSSLSSKQPMATSIC